MTEKKDNFVVPVECENCDNKYICKYTKKFKAIADDLVKYYDDTLEDTPFTITLRCTSAEQNVRDRLMGLRFFKKGDKEL